MSPLHYPSGIRKFLEKELKQKCDSVLGENSAKICVKADWGRPDSHLIEIAGESRVDLIVVGTSQRRGLARLGSVSRAVLYYAHMNVACVPTSCVVNTAPSELPRFKRVLVPIDFTESANQAIAVAYASVYDGGEVRLVHVVAPNRNGTAARNNGDGCDEDQKLFARLAALIPKSAASRGITTQNEVVEHHEPSAAIYHAAERFNADLICMRSRGRSRFKETIFGSVSQEVMARSNRAVLVLRGKERSQCSEVTKNESNELIKCGA